MDKTEFFWLSVTYIIFLFFHRYNYVTFSKFYYLNLFIKLIIKEMQFWKLRRKFKIYILNSQFNFLLDMFDFQSSSF